jgi:TonB-linked SusC/RagA family outer membrane protein
MRYSRSVWFVGVVAGLAAPWGADPAAAQGTGVVRGMVRDTADGRPIEGAQVALVGQRIGATTNASGQYVIREVPAGATTVRAQFIGYAAVVRPITVAPNDTVEVDFTMRRTAVVLSEQVVVGYGTASRREVSSAVASVQGTEVQNAPLAGVDAAMQGKAPGLQVIQNSGNPGVGITVRVRGAASLSASNQPLYVIDGVPLVRETYSQLDVGGQDITAVTGLSPDEIASIDVLKDAAAAAIYGSRGSNGVVMITTKRGRAGRPRISYNAYYGTQEAVDLLDLMSGPEYTEYMNEALTNDGYDPLIPPGTQIASTNWQEEVLRRAPVGDVYLSVDGGNERLRYLVSGSYFDQQGTVIGSGYQRQTARVNLDFNATSRLAFRTSVNLSREDQDRIENDNTISGVMANAIATPSVFPVRGEDGRFSNLDTFVGDAQMPYVNPVAVGTFNSANSRTLRALGNVEGTLSFTESLQWTSRLGLDVLNLRDLRWDSPRVEGDYAEGAGGVATQGNNTANRYVLESFLGYNWASGRNSVSLTGGGGAEWNENELEYIRGEGFASDRPQLVGNAGRVAEYRGDRLGYNLVSAFTRANVTLADRYLLTASLRTDGSSRFGEDNRYGTFPALSLGWIVSDEPTVGPAIARFASLKLRASYGETGNQGIDDEYAALGRYGRANYAEAPGIAPSNIANPDLRWETTREVNLGFDLGFLDGRVNLIGDFYNKKTSDLLVERPLPRTSGFAAFFDNVGNIENRGFELALNTINWERGGEGGFRWTTDFNIAWNRNRVTALYRDQPFNDGFDDINRVEVGVPLGAFHTIKFTGVDPETGNAQYLDADGDGAITSSDRVIVGSPHPTYFGGLTNSLTFKRFDLRAFVQFTHGNEVYNGMRAYADDAGYNLDNKFRNALNRWRQPGDVTNEPRASYDGMSDAWFTSSRFVEDGSYVRLQEVTLGYRLPEAIGRRTNLGESRIYVSGRNLKTWTDYAGFNPDANSSGSSTNISLGTDFYSYPLARTFSFGISGSF